MVTAAPMLLSLLATDALRTYCRSAQCVWVFAELYIACLLRCGTLAGNIKVDFCRSFKVASTSCGGLPRVPACVSVCTLSADLSVAVLRAAPV